MKKILPFLFCIFLLAACNNSSDNIKDQILKEIPPSATAEKQMEQVTADTSVSAAPPVINTSSQDWDKKIIKTAFLRLEVKDFKKYDDEVNKAAKQYGGYIAGEEQNQSEDKLETSVVIKVPVDKFESIMNDLPASATKIVEKKITTEDVTGEMVDTKSRLEAKKQMRLKYLEFLQRSKNMAEVLQVQNEINAIQEEIESAAGKINYLSHQSAYSTINLTFFQPLAGYNPSNDDPGFATKLINAFKGGFIFIGEIIIALISVWPILLAGIFAWLFFKRRTLVNVVAKGKV